MLGTGGPKPDPDRQGPALLLRAAGRAVLFDAGRGVSTRLLQAGQQPEDLDAIILTHHHFDHIGGLGDLLLSIWNKGRDTPLPVYGPAGTADIVAALFGQVYRADIRFREREAELTGDSLYPLDELYAVHDIEPGVRIELLPEISLRSEAVSHGHGLGIAFSEFPCLGYRVDLRDHVLAVSGDTVSCDGLDRLAQGADTLVLCCYLVAAEQTDFERDVVSRQVIMASDSAGKVAERAGVGRLVLTHIRRKAHSLLDKMSADVSADFSGEIVLAEDLMTLPLTPRDGDGSRS